MRQTTLRFAPIAVLPMLLGLSSAARAQPEDGAEDAPATPPAETPPSPSQTEPKTEPAPDPAATSSEPSTAQGPATFFEELGPETYPGRAHGPGGILATLFDWPEIELALPRYVRGLEGGSLWLEPSFHGLQWPQNTRTGIGFSGMFWIDSGYEAITRGDIVTTKPDPVTSVLTTTRAPTPNTTLFLQQGRGLLRVTPAYVSGRFFAQGQAELVANACQSSRENAGICSYAGTFSTDDLWVRVGHSNLWDLKVGRFQGWEVYHLGMGMDPYTIERSGAGMFGVANNASPALEVPTLYALDYLRERPTDGMGVGYVALHAYLTGFLRLEMLGKLGSSKTRADNADGAGTGFNYYGGRPTLVFDIGWFKLKLGGEYEKRTATTQTPQVGFPPSKKDPVENRVRKGAAGSLQFVVDPYVELGFSAAIGTQHLTNGMAMEIAEESYTTVSFGGFANVRLFEGMLLGLGGNRTAQTDSYKADPTSANDYTSQLQAFGALQYAIGRRLFIRAVAAYARAQYQSSDASVAVWNNTMLSGRIRLMYLY